MGIFSDARGQLTPQFSSRIWPNFEFHRALMHVIITCTYEKDRIKKQPRKSGNTVFSIITLSVAMETSRIWPNFKLIQALMYVIFTCKYEMDPIKNSHEKVATQFYPLQVYGDFFRRSRAANSAVGGWIWPNFELLRALMHVIITCKYEKDRINQRTNGPVNAHLSISQV